MADGARGAGDAPSMREALDRYVHRYLPPAPGDGRTLLLLHGTGGDETDLLPVADMLAPGAGILSPRGTVLEHGAARFFRRIAEGVFDIDDLHARTSDLIAFVDAAARHYGFDPGAVTAVGFSNGANIAASVLLSSPTTLAGAVLFRPMVPFVPETPVALSGVRVFIGAGRSDAIATPEQAERLTELLRLLGAEVTLAWQAGGHGLTRGDLAAAAEWFEEGYLATDD